ncbi:Rhomboid-domain-containing protein [Pleurostoma richardsiae]|uniref:Rhomboid-domain-containing protein n=1 Tax=Pleurostoma richardsiae TaxID=41990 RepID=A0AA38SBL8_9PEZI|nr:Rhomboid-domain-containing protein [Pleurostoma richardsiae]
MLRFNLRHLRAKAPLCSRAFSTTYTEYYGLPPLRVLGPTLWCIAAAGTVYLGCAGWEVYRDAKLAKEHRYGTGSQLTYDQIETARALYRVQQRHSEHAAAESSGWRLGDLPEADKFVAGTMGLNTAIFAATRAFPSISWRFAHVPAGPTNYTLFTSMFGHASLFHLGFNMYALYNFGPSVARSRTFQGSGSHLAAFYLSTGIFASLAHHLTSKFASPRVFPPAFVVPGLGASGAIFGIVSAWAMSYPNGLIGLAFIPGFSLPAQQALLWYSLFETYGLLVGVKMFRFAHAAHLAGLGIGSAYVAYGGRQRVWEPSRRFMFKQLRLLGLV